MARAVEPSAEAGTLPALKTWSRIKELHSELRVLGVPNYGAKDMLSQRLCECEHRAKILPCPSLPFETERHACTVV